MGPFLGREGLLKTPGEGRVPWKTSLSRPCKGMLSDTSDEEGSEGTTVDEIGQSSYMKLINYDTTALLYLVRAANCEQLFS